MSTVFAASTARPFVKWAGGKGSLVAQIRPYVPARYGRYYEPFLGGGAMLYALAPRAASVGDLNRELITAYQCVRDRPDALLAALAAHAEQHNKAYFLTQRAASPADPLALAARFIYLNRTCFNGLYRVNKSGRFNVPPGRYEHPMICDPATIFAASHALQRVNLACQPYAATIHEAQPGDLVYADPPYVPVSHTSNFTSYTREGFTYADQVALRDALARLRARGVQVMLSNADCPAIRELYQGWRIVDITASRAINSKASARGQKVGEILALSWHQGE